MDWLKELSKKYPEKKEQVEIELVVKVAPAKKRGRPVGSKNKDIDVSKDMTKEQWKAAYWKLRRRYRKECLNTTFNGHYSQ